MSQAKKILLSGYLALGFLALRLLYALVFSGLSGQQLLLALPEIRLSGPFSHVVLLGDISVDGIVRNIEIALPFALTIFAFGTLASFVSPRRLAKVAKRFPPLRNLLSAIAIGLSAIPGLFEANRKVFVARSLRGEKRLRMLVPILERAIELANALGLSLALQPAGAKRAQSVEISNLEIPDIALGPIDLVINSSDLVVISGATGSGKSTLLEAISGILSEYRGRKIRGRVSFDQHEDFGIAEIANFVGFVGQNPKEMIWDFDVNEICSKLSDELVASLGLLSLRAKTSSELSEGEALKLLLAQRLSAKPTILLLDEPFAPLDKKSRLELIALLTKLTDSGIAVVLVEHELSVLEALDARHYHLANGSLVPGRYRPAVPSVERSRVLVGSELAIQAELPDIGFDSVLISAASIKLYQAERIWLSGDNGVGKTTLLNTLAQSKDVLVHGNRNSHPSALSLVPENFDDFFVTDSLSAELTRADRVAGVENGFTYRTLESILPGQDLASWSDTHPRDLSRGTRLALAIAMQLSHKPQAILIDEPFRGLDPLARELMVESLRCVAETGCAILFASHEASWSAILATRRLDIQNQQLIEIAQVSA